MSFVKLIDVCECGHMRGEGKGKYKLTSLRMPEEAVPDAIFDELRMCSMVSRDTPSFDVTNVNLTHVYISMSDKIWK